MTARLNPDKKTIAGTETLYWKNTSTDKINELQFHLYLNAFKNTKSTFITESADSLEATKWMLTLIWTGLDWCNVVENKGREDLTGKIKFIHLMTIIMMTRRYQCTSPETPFIRQTITLQIKFNSKLPKVFARSALAITTFLRGNGFLKSAFMKKLANVMPWKDNGTATSTCEFGILCRLWSL